MHHSLRVYNEGRPENHERGIDRSIGSIRSILRPPETFGIRGGVSKKAQV